MRYKLKDRIVPSYRIKEKNYMLLHSSSFGEVKALINVVDAFEKNLKKKPVFSVFTDTGYKLIEDKEVFIMPLDLYPLYGMIFQDTPDIALFFETEIWPSYIAFLKNRKTKLALINARMSDKSFKLYSIFSFLFKSIIGKFDIIITKSDADALRFKKFNDNVVVCRNIKQIKKTVHITEHEIHNIKKRFKIDSKKPIMVFGSVHKEEIDFVIKSVSLLKKDFFIVVAPRHKEDAEEFYAKLQDISDISKRTSMDHPTNLLLLDTMGELEDIYKVSDVVFIGGSTNSTLKGHNPIEPLVYNKFIVCGQYMDSFKNETEDMKEKNLITQIYSEDELVKTAVHYISHRVSIDSESYFKSLSDILHCYIQYLVNL